MKTERITVEVTPEQIADPKLPVDLIPDPPEGFKVTNPRIIQRTETSIVIEYDLTETTDAD